MYDNLFLITIISIPLTLLFVGGVLYMLERTIRANSVPVAFTGDVYIEEGPELADMQQARAIHQQLRTAAMNPGHRSMEEAVLDEWMAMGLHHKRDTATDVLNLAARDRLPGFKGAVERAFAEA